ncbi:MAG: hypothetical protein WBC92_14885 [Terracidiphilus sp.]
MNLLSNAMAVPVLLMLAAALPAGGQNALAGPTAQVRDAIRPQGEVLREIDDPNLGDCWLLLRDPSHSGGPGRLVLAPMHAGVQGEGAKGRVPLKETRKKLPVIRAGDALIAEESTAVAEARLEAVALSEAAVGGELRVRLKIGGKVVRVVAAGPGRVVFRPEIGAER